MESYGHYKQAQGQGEMEVNAPFIAERAGDPVGESAEISESRLEALIPCFYERVRADALIGPVFDAAIDDWDLHLPKLVAFWSSVMLTSGRYKGNPVAAHMKHIGAITPPMFNRWLELWCEVTAEQLSPALAAELQEKAARIAESLKLALCFRLPLPSKVSDDLIAGSTSRS